MKMSQTNSGSRREAILEMKAAAGLLTTDEAAELRRIPITVGGPGGTIVVPRPARNEAEFEAMAQEGERVAQAWQAWDGSKPFRSEDHR
jgi:hypothetical protein